MKKVLTLLLVVAILACAFITNPTKARHREVMHEAIEQASAEYVDHHTGESLGGFFSGLISGIASTAISAAIDAQLHYHNYYLFSTCTMKMDGEQKVVSLGLFNQIITMDKDDVLEALGEGDDADTNDDVIDDESDTDL